MTIGIMGAMPEEIATIKSLMTNITETERGSRTYFQGNIGKHEVVLTFSRWGKVASSSTATTLISEFKATEIIFTGVAGAVSSDLEIGDIVISNQLYQHDMDATPLIPKFEVPLTDMIFFDANSDLIKKVQAAADTLLKKPSDAIPRSQLDEFKITAPKTMLGLIGTGDRFIADDKTSDTLLSEQPDTLAVEMEGAAVAQVCHDYGVPFVVIRTISDKANNNAHIDFPRFIKEIASHYSRNIIQSMLT